MNLKPLGDRVVLKPVDREEMTKGASIAAMILTTQAVITEIPEKNGNGMRHVTGDDVGR